MSLHSFALQKAIFAALAADAGVKDAFGDPARIFDGPPDSAAMPYAVLGETRVERLVGHPGAFAHDIRIAVISRWQGRREIKRALDRLYDALHERDLALDGARLVNLRFVFADVIRRGEGETHEGLARFRAVTEAL